MRVCSGLGRPLIGSLGGSGYKQHMDLCTKWDCMDPMQCWRPYMMGCFNGWP